MQALQNVYWLGDEDRIVRVSEGWDRFARENEGKAGSSWVVVGQPIWGFVLGDATRMWLNTVLQLARVRRDPVERTYRCDSPETIRHMKMRIVPEDAGVLRVEHTVLASEARQALVQVVAGPEAAPVSACGAASAGGSGAHPAGWSRNGWQHPGPVLDTGA